MEMSKDKVEVVEKQKLKTLEDIETAHEYVFNQQVSGKIDAKTADALNTTLKGSVALKKLRLEVGKLYYLSQVKKIQIPNEMMIELAKEQSEEVAK